MPRSDRHRLLQGSPSPLPVYRATMNESFYDAGEIIRAAVCAVSAHPSLLAHREIVRQLAQRGRGVAERLQSGGGPVVQALDLGACRVEAEDGRVRQLVLL